MVSTSSKNNEQPRSATKGAFFDPLMSVGLASTLIALSTSQYSLHSKLENLEDEFNKNHDTQIKLEKEYIELNDELREVLKILRNSQGLSVGGESGGENLAPKE